MTATELKFLVDVGVGKKVEEYLLGKGYDTKSVRSLDHLTGLLTFCFSDFLIPPSHFLFLSPQFSVLFFLQGLLRCLYETTTKIQFAGIFNEWLTNLV